MTLNYFGTDLRSAGHYFWELERDGIYSSRIRLEDCPFNPEGLPRKNKGEGFLNGRARFYNFAGFSIYAIEGSCVDTRPGSKSIFFVEREMTKDELKNQILSTPIGKKIIEQMPFAVDW